jgi:beta-fructofuranosidase
MKITILPILMIMIMLDSCQQKQKVNLVQSGEPGLVKFSEEEWTLHEEYMETRGECFLIAENAIPVGEFQVHIKMEIGSYESVIWILTADNRFGFNLVEDELPAFWGLSGPSFGRSIWTDVGVQENIPVGKPFELEIRYKDKMLEYLIDGQSIIKEIVINEPFGRVGLNGWSRDGYVRIYDFSVEGDMVPWDECYSRERLLERAQRSVDHMAAIVKDDPNRPLYHLQPPANWNNDPNGTLHYKGYYHVFYQHNPFDDRWDWMHWGHMRSRDLVKWEHLPIALWPSVELGENHCFSGSAIVNSLGEPMLFYTSIGDRAPEQWVAIPMDDELITWKKHPDNPILDINDHKGEVIEDWRDPQLIHEGDETFMVVGGHPEDMGGSIMLYKALNDELTEWDYLGTAFSGDEGNWECPNFFRIGDKFILIYSPHGDVRYYTGTFDLENYTFNPEKQGWVDHGSNYYAPNTFEDESGRRLLLGWIPGFKENQGWQSAMTVPRHLTVSPEGWLLQNPVEELVALRGENQHMDEFVVSRSTDIEIPEEEFEMVVEFENISATAYGIILNTEEDQFMIAVYGNFLKFGERDIDLKPYKLGRKNTIRLLYDRTVLELYLNDGIVCATSVVYPDRQNPGWRFFSDDGDVKVGSMDIWKMGTIY